jgi:hypothetical protein
MKSYFAELPPSAWVVFLLSLVFIAHLMLPAMVRATVPTSVCNFLRLL